MYDVPRSRAVARSTLALLAGLLASGCAGAIGAGVHEYDHGRYPEANERLREAEHDACALGHKGRVRYALYRGLTHLALGDRPATLRWLGEARQAVQADPTLLADDDLGRLSAAWAHLGGTPPGD